MEYFKINKIIFIPMKNDLVKTVFGLPERGKG